MSPGICPRERTRETRDVSFAAGTISRKPATTLRDQTMGKHGKKKPTPAESDRMERVNLVASVGRELTREEQVRLQMDVDIIDKGYNNLPDGAR